MIALLVLFALTATMGLVLATRLIRGKPRLVALAWAHGAPAIVGVLVLIELVTTPSSSILSGVALAMFVVAAALGLGLLGIRLLGKEQPIPLAVLHGMAAASGITLLAAAVAGIG